MSTERAESEKKHMCPEKGLPVHCESNAISCKPMPIAHIIATSCRHDVDMMSTSCRHCINFTVYHVDIMST